MQSKKYREDEREVLTNKDIKVDLKKDFISELIKTICAILAIALLCFCFFQIVRTSLEYPLLHWAFIFLLVLYVLLGIRLLVVGIRHAILYTKAISHNQFFVTKDKLIHKEEGRSSLVYRFLFFIGFYLLALFYRPRPNCYEFLSGTYTVPVETPHYRRSIKFAMNGATLFRRSHNEDSFLLVSVNPGKLLKIYPEDAFDYKDSSPL